MAADHLELWGCFVTRYFNNEDAQTLSPIIDVAAARFNHQLKLEHEAKVDLKIKARQFVKIYGQMASIMPYELCPMKW